MKKFIKILAGTIFSVFLLLLLTKTVFDPWLGRKLVTELNEKNSKYIVEIGKLHILIVNSGIHLEGVKIYSKQKQGDNHALEAEIESVKFKGIKLVKAIIWNDIHIGAVTITNSNIKGKIPFSEDALPPVVSPVKIGIGSILFDKVNLEMKNDSTSQYLSVKDGVLKVYDFLLGRKDTLFPAKIELFDLEARELISVQEDNMYTYIVKEINYSPASNALKIDSLCIQPNYADYDFTSRNNYQTTRIEAVFSNIRINDFNFHGNLKSLDLMSSYIEIGEADLKLFRDKRVDFRHLDKPSLLDMLYGYPGKIRIDSIGLLNGNLAFTMHAEEANEAGSISVNKIKAKILNVTNDTIYKTEAGFMEVKADALIMGKGKMTIWSKGRIYDRENTFSLDGTLSGLAVNELNPILEKSVYIYATSGIIDLMNFSFTADNTKAAGEMTMLYNGLDITVKNKRTDDTTALRERFISFLANRKIMDSNPLKDEKARVGIIDFERDPERLVFHYCFNSVLSGIKSSLTRRPGNRN
jgi:hypothetical protein